MRGVVAGLWLLCACGEGVEPDLDEPAECGQDDPLTYPGAPEICDGVDNDCNGIVDDDPVDAAVWYEDRDNDRWGDVDSWIRRCFPVDGYTDRFGDCDDLASTANPGRAEVCDDDVDNDCDGLVDEDCDDG